MYIEVYDKCRWLGVKKFQSSCTVSTVAPTGDWRIIVIDLFLFIHNSIALPSVTQASIQQTMNKNVALSFYIGSPQRSIKSYEPPKSGWQRCVIYQGRHLPRDLGCSGSMMFFKLSDGRVILTNDLWYDDLYVSILPEGAIVGYPLNTRVCRPLSREASDSLAEMLQQPGRQQKGFDPIWRTKSNLSDEEAYELTSKFHGSQLPEGTSRTFHSSSSHAYFSSPENVVISHVKVGVHDLVAFQGPEQLACVDPATTPLFILYHKDSYGNALQRGDTEIETYVYDNPEWTQGSKGSK